MRESSSKDSSAEDEALGDHDISARRVTFRADHRLESTRATLNYPLRKCASVSFQQTSTEKRLKMMSHEH